MCHRHILSERKLTVGAVLSVVVPSYNVEKYIEKCLTSFSDERFRGLLDVIIVNDGSQDSTREIAEGYVRKYPGIFRLINKENGGHGSAVNTGIENACGKYFRIVDGDDWIHTENMLKLLDILQKTDSDMVVDEKREVNMVTADTEFFPLPAWVEENKVIAFEDICNQNDICTYIMLHTLSVKTELLKKNSIRLQEHIFYVDIEFIIKATMEAETIEFHRIEIYQYLVGNVNQSVSAGNYVKRYSHHDTVTKELIRYANAKSVHAKSAGGANAARYEYLDRRICLLINTHMNISLIYNKDRKQGLSQAKEFRRFLKNANRKYYKATARRYMEARILHALGFDYDRLAGMRK